MKTIIYNNVEYKCEVTYKDSNAMRVRVYDTNNVGNLYIWTNGYDMPRPYKYNRSKHIVKNVVLLAFQELNKVDEETTPIQDAAMTVMPDESPRLSRRPRTDRFS